MDKKKSKFNNFGKGILNDALMSHKKTTFIQKLVNYSSIILIIVFVIFFIIILVLLIRKRIIQMNEKMRRLKLHQEINKLMMVDIVESKTQSFDSNNKGFQPLSNDSNSGDIGNSDSALPEININNDRRNLKSSIDS